MRFDILQRHVEVAHGARYVINGWEGGGSSCGRRSRWSPCHSEQNYRLVGSVTKCSEQVLSHPLPAGIVTGIYAFTPTFPNGIGQQAGRLITALPSMAVSHCHYMENTHT